MHMLLVSISQLPKFKTHTISNFSQQEWVVCDGLQQKLNKYKVAEFLILNVSEEILHGLIQFVAQELQSDEFFEQMWKMDRQESLKVIPEDCL